MLALAEFSLSHKHAVRSAPTRYLMQPETPKCIADGVRDPRAIITSLSCSAQTEQHPTFGGVHDIHIPSSPAE